MSGLPCMYAIQPAFKSSVHIEYPNCMYAMKNILAPSVEVDFAKGSCNDACVKVDEKRCMGILEQKPLVGMKELEARQEAILEQLAQLKVQVATLRANLKQPCSTDIVKTTKSVSVAHNCAPSAPKIKLSQYDLVINASPEFPPYSLLAVCHLWKNIVPLQVSWHIHSNITAVSNDAKSLMAANWENSCRKNAPLMKISVVWKNVGPETELIVTPMSRIAIKGEVNILRFLNCLNPLFTESINDDPAFITEVDDVLDLCHSLIWSRTVKEKQALVRLLSGKLQKSQFLMGSSPTIADIAAWSALKQVVNVKDLTVSMGKWAQRCCQLFLQE